MKTDQSVRHLALVAAVDPTTAGAGVRPWARLGLAAQVVFVVSWIFAALWQGPRYSTVAHSISDLYAVTAPGGAFLVVVFTICGAATMMFALRSLLRALRPGGWAATVGAWLLALSIFGLGDLLSVTERLACRMADPGCTTARQVSNLGGRLDNVMSTVGVVLTVLAGLFLARAMRSTPGWQRWARPVRWTMLALFAVAIADLVGSDHGLGGFFERVIALVGAAWIAVLAAGVLRRSRTAAVPGDGR